MLKNIVSFIKSLLTKKSDINQSDLELIENWERECENGEFSHFYYHVIS